jgi:S-DNA-T family DNA segregation ATPase FtsK/SpoIIIE
MHQILNLNNILNSYKIKASCTNYQEVGNYFYYDLVLQPTAKIKDITKYSDEIALLLKAPSKPNISIRHQEGLVRLEFAKIEKNNLSLYNLFKIFDTKDFKIPCVLGQKVDGSLLTMDLAENPHLLIAGTTGSGKSTLLHNIIANILHYDIADLHLVDPKQVEFSGYSSIRTVAYSYNSALQLIKSLHYLMEQRYSFLKKGDSLEWMTPQILVIDEFANLMLQDKNNEFHDALCDLAQKSRGANIFIIIATQRPSAQIISGNIKANFPARIACKVASHFDSKIILDEVGAENLSGKGDALIKDNFRFLERFQIAMTSSKEILQNERKYKIYS